MIRRRHPTAYVVTVVFSYQKRSGAVDSVLGS
jgi:hypothetical protein